MPKYLQTCDESGRPHMLRLDEAEAGLHWQRRGNQICPCDPRIVDGVVVHRSMTSGKLYAPWEQRGH